MKMVEMPGVEPGFLTSMEFSRAVVRFLDFDSCLLLCLSIVAGVQWRASRQLPIKELL
jgi:hypothetical protein